MAVSIRRTRGGRLVSQCRLAMVILAFVAGAILAEFGGLRAQAADPPNLDEVSQRLLMGEGKEQSRVLADQQRCLLVEQAIALHEKEQRQATEELGRLAIMRERIEHLRDTQAWALGNSFEAGRRGILPEPTKVSQTLERWRNLRERSLRTYLEFPEHSRGAVTSGRALNFFMDLCAEVVMSHELWRSQLQDELRRTEARLRQWKEHSPGGVVLREDERKELESLERERDEAKSRLSLLDNLQGKPLLGQEQLRHLRFQKGLVGPVLTIARDDVMPLSWPYALAVDPDLASARQVMEKAKQAALEELRAGSGLPPQAQSDLMAAADELRNAFDAARPRLLEESAGDAVRVQQYLDAKHFVQEARHGVYRLVAARELADVMPSESFAGQTVDQLMSYMARQGLRFAPADPNGDAAYETVFRLMADYYVGLHSLAMAVDQGDRKIAALDAEASRLTELRDRDTLAALKEVLEARPGRDAFERLSDVAETLAAIQETLFPLARALARNAEAAPFQPGDLVCEDCLGMREWRGEIVNIDGPNCWVNILYSRSKHHHVGQRCPFPKHHLQPCPKTGTIEVPRIYRLAHLPPLRSVPRPVPAVPIRPAPSHR